MTTLPPQCPPRGLCVPVEIVRVRDGDTVEVRLYGGGWTWAVRLIDCWAPDRGQPGFEAATRQVKDLISRYGGGQPYLYVPTTAMRGNLLRLLTFDRIPGVIYMTPTETLNRLMVVSGHAFATKAEQRAAQREASGP